MVDESRVAVTVVEQSNGAACLVMNHPDGPTLASVVLTDEIIDYLMENLPRYRALGLGSLHGMTGPH